jgi:hypothetical protein
MADFDTQFPLNAVGPSGQHAFVGVHRVFFTGLTGNVGTAYGVPGLSITRSRTGVYSVTHQKIRDITVIPDIQSPSGTQYNVNFLPEKTVGLSGTMEFHVSKYEGSIVSGASPSLTHRPHNPVSGVVLSMFVYGKPVTPY